MGYSPNRYVQNQPEICEDASGQATNQLPVQQLWRPFNYKLTVPPIPLGKFVSASGSGYVTGEYSTFPPAIKNGKWDIDYKVVLGVNKHIGGWILKGEFAIVNIQLTAGVSILGHGAGNFNATVENNTITAPINGTVEFETNGGASVKGWIRGLFFKKQEIDVLAKLYAQFSFTIENVKNSPFKWQLIPLQYPSTGQYTASDANGKIGYEYKYDGKDVNTVLWSQTK